MRIGLVAALVCVLAPAAWGQDCGGTGALADCDADGYTLADGDCDDVDATVHPGRREACGDEIDNNCDGLFDEDCDRSAQLGSIRGGGGCTGGDAVGGTAWIVLPLLPLAFRRRRQA